MNNAKMDHPASLTFVFVHGAWHGGWCWDNVVQLHAQPSGRSGHPGPMTVAAPFAQ